MKVIAIKDAPSLPNGFFTFRGKTFGRAYLKGDIFVVSDRDDGHPDELIIEHPLIGDTMLCKRSNFMTLEEFRQIKLEQIGI